MKAIKTLVIILSIFMVAFPVSGRSITKKYITTDNIIKAVYVATNFEKIAKRELSNQFFVIYSLAYETIFGEP